LLLFSVHSSWFTSHPSHPSLLAFTFDSSCFILHSSLLAFLSVYSFTFHNSHIILTQLFSILFISFIVDPFIHVSHSYRNPSHEYIIITSLMWLQV
jgi:hypothetical protein